MARLRDKAYNVILQKIISKEILPSTPLDLLKTAEGLGMSVTPVRDALKQLEAEGIVEMIPRHGTFIKHFTLQDLIQTYELVEALEGMAGYLVAEQIASGKLGQDKLICLDTLIQKMDKLLTPEGAREWSQYDSEFHKGISHLCANTHLCSIHGNIITKMNSVLSFMTPLYIDRHNSMREHREILAAIKEGNSEKARAVCQIHRNTVRKIFTQLP